MPCKGCYIVGSKKAIPILIRASGEQNWYNKGQHYISKRGRPMLLKLLFFTAIKTVQSHRIMYGRYQQMLSKGTPKLNALVVIARRLLRIIALVFNLIRHLLLEKVCGIQVLKDIF